MNETKFITVEQNSRLQFSFSVKDQTRLTARLTHLGVDSLFILVDADTFHLAKLNDNSTFEKCEISNGSKRISLGDFVLRMASIDDSGLYYTELRSLDSVRYSPEIILPLLENENLGNLGDIPKLKPKMPHTVEMRQSPRIDVHPEDGIVALLYVRQKGKSILIPAAVYDLSTLGLSVVVAHPHFSEIISDFEEIGVYIRMASGYETELFCELRSVVELQPGRFRLGMKNNLSSLEIKTVEQIKPRDEPLLLSSRNHIAGVIYKQNVYFERCSVKLLGLSRKYVLAVAYENDLVLFTGMKVEISLLADESGILRVSGFVRKINFHSASKIQFLIEITDLPAATERGLINHIVLNEDYTLDQLRDAGFKVKEIADNIKFRYVKTQEDYIEVLKLRLTTYGGAGKVKTTAVPKDMVAPLDGISRILTAYHQGKMVASVALAFPDNENVTLDTERALANGYPKDFPKKVEMLEVARLCTDPGYRRGDLVYRMMIHLTRILAQSGRRYIISSCEKKLWPLYKSMGMKKVGLQYNHPYLEGLVHDIILFDVQTMTHGKDLESVRWNDVYGRMTRYLVENDLLDVPDW